MNIKKSHFAFYREPQDLSQRYSVIFSNENNMLPLFSKTQIIKTSKMLFEESISCIFFHNLTFS
jgi:hypothetical protein